MKFNLKLIARLIGLLLMYNGGFMALCLPFSFYYREDSWVALLISACITSGAGLALYLLFYKYPKVDLKRKDGYLIVAAGWIFMSLFGSLPYLISGAIPSVTNAFFETISGYTTTGASILNDIESLPKGVLFWRSFTQWIGGMGIIVLTVAILPILGIGGMQMFVAEAPGVTPDKLKPRITDTAKRLWLIYVCLTFGETILLMFGGMDFYEAINHGMTTMATGGFSTKQDSIAFYTSPYIQYVIIVFMFLAGTNFSITYFALHNKFKRVWKNDEFRYYLFFILGLGAITTCILWITGGQGFEKSLREGLFQVISIVTTTGYVTADYTQWVPFLMVLMFMLMFIGGSAGSTSGGIKVVRHIILLKNSILELRRLVHPSAVIPVRLNKRVVSPEITYTVQAFMIIYFMAFAAGSLIIASLGVDFMTAIGAVATSIGNVGPGLGGVGPVDNFASIPPLGKWVLGCLMLLGRLELFTILLLFSPSFWRS